MANPATPTETPTGRTGTVKPLVALSVVLVIGLLGLGGTWAACWLLSPDVTVRELPITAAEKLLLPQLAGLIKTPVPPGDETFRKTRRGAVLTLEYEYAPAETTAADLGGAPTDPAREALANDIAHATPRYRVMSTVWIEPDVAACRMAYADQVKLWLTDADRQQHSLLTSGDEALAVVLGQGGENQGNLVICRQGQKLLLTVFTGVSFADAASLSQALDPYLSRWTAYQPAP